MNATADLVEMNFLNTVLCIVYGWTQFCQINTVTLSCSFVYISCSFIINNS